MALTMETSHILDVIKLSNKIHKRLYHLFVLKENLCGVMCAPLDSPQLSVINISLTRPLTLSMPSLFLFGAKLPEIVYRQ